MSETPEEVLRRLLIELCSEDSTTRLAALYDLWKLDNSNGGVLRQVESSAMSDPHHATRCLALDLLDTPMCRSLRQTISP